MKKAESIINLLKKILIIVGKHKKKNQKGQKENSYVFLNRPTQNYYMCLGYILTRCTCFTEILQLYVITTCYVHISMTNIFAHLSFYNNYSSFDEQDAV